MEERPREGDPYAAVEALLERAAGETPDRARTTLEEALSVATSALGGAPAAQRPRALAFVAEVQRRLERPVQAASAYAQALLGRLEDAQALWEGLLDLLEDLEAYEVVLDLVVRARARHPGRAWQWDPIQEEARRRLDLEARAPLDPQGLERLRAEVARRLEAAPCRHDDAGRPAAAAAAGALGLDAARVLAFLSDLGACCCDCQVVSVRGLRKPSSRPPPSAPCTTG